MAQEGRIEVEDGYGVWFRVAGEPGRTPVLVLHGGPGSGHDYLVSLEDLAADRQVVFYDQLGCGRSDQPDDPSRWTMRRFVDEVDLVRKALNLDRVVLYGQSWGGWLAIEYVLGAPSGVEALVLASTSASLPQFSAETLRLRAELPAEHCAALSDGEQTGDFSSDAYVAAATEFYRRHLCRLDEWPRELLRTAGNLDGNQVYETMNGPNEFTVVGNLRDWDRTERLGEILVPTLITCGRHDETTPDCARTLNEGIEGSKLVVFESSAHVAHIEERQLYMRVVGDFLHSLPDRAG